MGAITLRRAPRLPGDEAAGAGLGFRFESAVMDGASGVQSVASLPVGCGMAGVYGRVELVQTDASNVRTL